MTIALINFLPTEGDPHGPRTGSYVYGGEPGLGGSFDFQDSLILLCPANPASLVADTQTVARWYKTGAGGINGRADAKAAAGQIPAGDTWEGVTCEVGVSGSEADEIAYWMLKLEDGNGNTIQGSAVSNSTGANSCDAVFGSVPSFTSNATDYAFSAAVTFPNQW